MGISLYDVTVPAHLQTLGAVSRLLLKTKEFCAEKKIASSELIQTRLAPDMQPFAYQVKSTAVHSLGAIEGVRRGVFSPDATPPPETLEALESRISETVATLEAIDRAEIDAFLGRDMRFEYGEHRLEFTAEDFLLSFSLPNFYFHATTAYDILRSRGMQIGKRDFMGRMRLKVPR